MLANVYVQGADLTTTCSINGTATTTATLNTTGYLLLVQQVANLVVNYTGMTIGSYYTVQVACKDGTVISQSVPAQ